MRSSPVTQHDLREIEREALRITNAERAKTRGGLRPPPLAWNEQCAVVARSHALDLVVRGFKGHVTPEGHGLRQRLEDAGIGFVFGAENIAGCAPDGRSFGFTSVVDALKALMRSPRHRRNIVSLRYTDLGCGAWRNVDGTFVLVQVFLRPRPPAVRRRFW